ncbi:MAG: hypothetical protein IJU64_06025 [Bacilli bacterium]|nr:hypothetical protein [Bacilli bacterium]
MKHPIRILLPVLAATLGSCSLVKTFEQDLEYRVIVGETIVEKGTINIFNNAVLPEVASRSGEQIFYKWYVGEGSYDSKTDPSRLYAEEGLIRYNDVSKYATGNVVNIKAVYLNPEDIPAPYLTIRWYAKTGTSGLDQATIDNWQPSLVNYLKTQGATAEDLADIDIKGYDGAVADFGAAVLKDKVVDVVIGVGNNIDSATGGKLPVKEKAGNIPMNGKTRYVARLNDKPLTVALYQWLQTPEGYAGFTL